MTWRVAKSLLTLRAEVNARYPNRPTAADGTIGDAAHSNRTSDHNPNASGVVCALDLTEWVQGGVEMNDVLAEHLRSKRDPRIKYVISDGRMFSSYPTSNRRAWDWGPYSGTNAHTKHVHISVHGNYDSTASWGFKSAPKPAPWVIGAILEKYKSVGGDQGFLGKPLTPETATPDKVGRFNHFEGGSIYWHPDLGAYVVMGGIRASWEKLSWEAGVLGYPRTDEFDYEGLEFGPGKQQHFQRGFLTWRASDGHVFMHQWVMDT